VLLTISIIHGRNQRDINRSFATLFTSHLTASVRLTHCTIRYDTIEEINVD